MKVMIGTPTYDGRVSTGFAGGVTDLTLKHGDVHHVETVYLRGTVIDRARDFLAYLALKKEMNLLFIDSDISFDHRTARKLLDAAEKTDAGVIGVPYPRRLIDDDAIVYSVATIEGPDGDPDEHGLCEVSALPAGFTLIKHEVLLKLSTIVRSYRQGEHLTPRMFPSLMTKDSDFMYGEDFSFCILAKNAGFKIKALTGCPITHEGDRMFTGTWTRDAKSIW